MIFSVCMILMQAFCLKSVNLLICLTKSWSLVVISLKSSKIDDTVSLNDVRESNT
ncbi:MAG: hypothetical protein KZQ83_13320 [gamma proteobacterium symbiont of Taylorina sp.]|nr:hypothetical protein [gamma proteobacterium symbiont of Taylorina sp.]